MLDQVRLFIEFVPLFNFTANITGKLSLDSDTWLAPLDEATRGKVIQAVDQSDTLLSRDILTSLRWGVFHRFALANPAVTQPPDQDLELDARVIFKILQPDSTVTTGYHAYYSEKQPLSGGSRRASEFRGPGPTYELHTPDAARLPDLWRELRKIMSRRWLRHSRFFHTARVRLWRASHDQNQQQRLLDLFIALESLLLRGSEQWSWSEKKGALPFGPSRLTSILDPTAFPKAGLWYAKVVKAHEQRNTIAHGLDRQLVGFDGSSATFGELASAVEQWTPLVLHRFLRLLHHAGSKDGALDQLDRLVADPVANDPFARQLLDPVK